MDKRRGYRRSGFSDYAGTALDASNRRWKAIATAVRYETSPEPKVAPHVRSAPRGRGACETGGRRSRTRFANDRTTATVAPLFPTTQPGVKPCDANTWFSRAELHAFVPPLSPLRVSKPAASGAERVSADDRTRLTVAPLFRANSQECGAKRAASTSAPSCRVALGDGIRERRRTTSRRSPRPVVAREFRPRGPQQGTPVYPQRISVEALLRRTSFEDRA